MTDLDIYANFVLHAIYGRMGEADTIMQRAGDSVRHVADQLRAEHPIEPKALYRGMLLDPDAQLRVDPRYTFLSWSEDRDVARWFAWPNSVISQPLAASNAKLRGYVLTLEQPRSRVLFHYSWIRRAFRMPFERLALFHPFMGAEGCRQIGWSLRTQSEVITEPLPELPSPEPIERVTGVPLAELDLQFTPPWCRDSSPKSTSLTGVCGEVN